MIQGIHHLGNNNSNILNIDLVFKIIVLSLGVVDILLSNQEVPEVQDQIFEEVLEEDQ